MEPTGRKARMARRACRGRTEPTAPKATSDLKAQSEAKEPMVRQVHREQTERQVRKVPKETPVPK